MTSPRRSVLLSDEENTSEYSHPPSSQHSTLESNPELTLNQLKRMADKQEVHAAAASDSESEAELHFGDNLNGNEKAVMSESLEIEVKA